jgi:hypothetical protein
MILRFDDGYYDADAITYSVEAVGSLVSLYCRVYINGVNHLKEVCCRPLKDESRVERIMHRLIDEGAKAAAAEQVYAPQLRARALWLEVGDE